MTKVSYIKYYNTIYYSIILIWIYNQRNIGKYDYHKKIKTHKYFRKYF